MIQSNRPLIYIIHSLIHYIISVFLGCTVWNNNDPYKIKLSAPEIGAAIFERSADLPESSLHAVAGRVTKFMSKFIFN